MSDTLPVLLMTRPRVPAERFVAELPGGALRFRTVYTPLFGIEITGHLPHPSTAAGLIFTSANGVTAWKALGGRRDLPVFTVGKATAQVAQALGMRATSADGSADDLVAMILAMRPAAPLLHIRGTHSRGDVAQRLTRAGLPTQEAILYDQPELGLTDEAKAVLLGEAPVIAPLFSPRTAALLAKAPTKAPLLVAGISQAVVNAAAPLHICKRIVAIQPDSTGMLSAVSQLLADAGEWDKS